ncbi:unnamed protein product [Amoebophrya sp. A120]|nr:unnamed protein product [Amoebophrya sp. A120]|eukprot:GSA120T00019776001.1
MSTPVLPQDEPRKAKKTCTIVIVRHGERLDYEDSTWVLSRSSDPESTPYDPPLTDRGFQMARQAGREIAKLLQEVVEKKTDKTCAARPLRIITSPLLRCVQTSCGLREGLLNLKERGQLGTREAGDDVGNDNTREGEVGTPSGSSCSRPIPFHCSLALTEVAMDKWYLAWCVPNQSDGSWGGPYGFKLPSSEEEKNALNLHPAATAPIGKLLQKCVKENFLSAIRTAGGRAVGVEQGEQAGVASGRHQVEGPPGRPSKSSCYWLDRDGPYQDVDAALPSDDFQRVNTFTKDGTNNKVILTRELTAESRKICREQISEGTTVDHHIGCEEGKKRSRDADLQGAAVMIPFACQSSFEAAYNLFSPETSRELKQRMKNFVAELETRFPNETLILCTHGGPTSAAVTALSGAHGEQGYTSINVLVPKERNVSASSPSSAGDTDGKDHAAQHAPADAETTTKGSNRESYAEDVDLYDYETVALSHDRHLQCVYDADMQLQKDHMIAAAKKDAAAGRGADSCTRSGDVRNNL